MYVQIIFLFIIKLKFKSSFKSINYYFVINRIYIIFYYIYINVIECKKLFEMLILK